VQSKHEIMKNNGWKDNDYQLTKLYEVVTLEKIAENGLIFF